MFGDTIISKPPDYENIYSDHSMSVCVFFNVKIRILYLCTFILYRCIRIRKTIYEVRVVFCKNIRLEKVPGKLECINAQRECSVLSILPWKK